MKIVFITNEIPYPDNSGGRKYTWQRIKMLKELGHEIFLVSIIDDENEIDKDMLYKFCTDVVLIKKYMNIKKMLRCIFVPYTVCGKESPDILKAINRWKKDEGIDLIISDFPQMFNNIKTINDIPVFITQHNIEYVVFKRVAESSKNLITKLAYYHESLKLYLYEKKINKYDAIKGFTFISEEDIDIYRQKFKIDKKATVVPMAMDLVPSENEKNITSDKTKKIVFTGKMSYKPNVDAMIWFVNNIFNKICNGIENVNLYIVGKDPTEAIKNLANNNIIVTGQVDSVKKYMDEADLIVIPLLSGGGVKIKLIEALQSKTPIVTTSIGCEGTKFENGKHLYVENDEDKFANRCIEILQNPSDYKWMTDEGYKLLEEEYGFKNIALKYEQFLIENK